MAAASKGAIHFGTGQPGRLDRINAAHFQNRALAAGVKTKTIKQQDRSEVPCFDIQNPEIIAVDLHVDQLRCQVFGQCQRFPAHCPGAYPSAGIRRIDRATVANDGSGAVGGNAQLTRQKFAAQPVTGVALAAEVGIDARQLAQVWRGVARARHRGCPLTQGDVAGNSFGACINHQHKWHRRISGVCHEITVDGADCHPCF